jgi:aspartate/methionine/tyrosine aminotransferase
MEELENAITEKTRAFILNPPHNPTGKMFSREEMIKIAEIMERHPQVTIMSDEVYEHIVFDEENSPHISFATIPGMYERTITLSSSGKTFAATGWKVGWAVGPPHLVHAVTSVQQWVNFSAPTPNQDAIAMCLLKAKEPYEGHESYYKWVAEEYRRKRALLCDALRSGGMEPIVPNGGFFIMTDTSTIDLPPKYLEEKTVAMPTDPMPRDWALSRFMTKEVGVTAIPPSAFYDTVNVPLAKNLLRFAYCKGDDVIIEAGERFKTFFADKN